MRGRARLENFYISGFPGNGVHVVASHPIDNANGWFMIYGRIDLCSGNGIHTRGQDSNAGTAVAIDVGSCGGWGIREQSMMGNTFIGCQSAGNGYVTWAASTARVVGDKRAPKLANGFYYQVQSVVGDALTGTLEPTWPTIVGNTVVDNHVTWICQGSQSGGAYRADNAGAAPIFIGCYSEGGQQPAFLTDAALMLGGIPGAWYDPNSSGLAMLSRFYNPLVVDKLGNQGMVARLGSTVSNGVLEWQNGANLPYRIQSGLTEPLYWDFAYGNTPNYTSLRLGDGGNARLGVSELWMPRGYWFGGIQKDFGTSGRRGHETGVLDSQRVLFDAVVADNVPNVVTNNGTATINFYHNLPTYSTDGKRDVRVAVRNVAGTTVVNGAWRGRPSGVSLLELRNLSDGTNVTLTGSYTANTGVVMVLRAVIDGAGPPASATFYAIGDVVRNQNTSNGILYWCASSRALPAGGRRSARAGTRAWWRRRRSPSALAHSTMSSSWTVQGRQRRSTSRRLRLTTHGGSRSRTALATRARLIRSRSRPMEPTRSMGLRPRLSTWRMGRFACKAGVAPLLQIGALSKLSSADWIASIPRRHSV